MGERFNGKAPQTIFTAPSTQGLRQVFGRTSDQDLERLSLLQIDRHRNKETSGYLKQLGQFKQSHQTQIDTGTLQHSAYLNRREIPPSLLTVYVVLMGGEYL